jgi:curved DNA-binding protein CbpA
VIDATRLAILSEYQRMASLDHYGVLGVDRKASVPDIKKAYIAAAKRWHSDSFAGVDLGPAEPYLQAVFSAVGEAHRVLTDERTRGEYDVLIYRQERGLPTDVSKILEAEELFGKAQHLFKNNRIQEAEGLLRRAVELNHAEGEFWSYLGACGYRLRGSAAAAGSRESFARARELAPSSHVTDLFEGQLESGEGNLDAAERLLKRFLVQQPDNVDASRELKLVREKREKSRGVIDKLLNRK